MPQQISSHQDLLEAAHELARNNSDMGRALTRVEAELGPLPDRSRPEGFASLLFLIAAQQVSTASARAIWQRIESAVSPLTPDTWLAQPEDIINTLGLSRPKKIYARALAAAMQDETLDLIRLSAMDLPKAESHLCRVKGIGPWTAQAYLLFSMGRMDAFPAGDIALQSATGRLLGLASRPSTAEIEEIAEAWRPVRGIAAHILWAFYKTLQDPGQRR